MVKKKVATETSTLTVDQVVSDFQQSWEYVSGSYHDKWDDIFQLYNNQRVDRAYQGITDTFVPITFTTIEVMVAAIGAGKPKFTYIPQEISQNQDTEPLNSLLDYFWDCDKWSAKVNQWIRTMLMYGTGVLYAYWDMDKPRLLHVPIRDFFFDATASGPETAQFMGRRYLTTKESLKEVQIVDPATGEMVPKYTNLDKVTEQKAGKSEPLDKEKKDMYMGSTLGDKASQMQIEIIEYWTCDRVYTVANRQVMIQNDENPYLTQAKSRKEKNPKGLIPFIVQRDYIDESLFLGKGEIEPMMGQQELLNDLTNQNIDSVTYTLNQMYTLDPKYADWLEHIENLPGAVYPFEEGALNPVTRGIVPPQAFEERSNLKAEIRETTAANEIFSFNMGGQKLTSTAINNIQAQVGQRFDIKIDMLENDGFHQLGRLVFRMIQLYLDKPMPIKVNSGQSSDWQVFDPGMYKGDYEPMVQLQSTQDKKQVIDTQKYQSLYTAMLNNPFVNQLELTKFILQQEFKLDPDEVDTLVKSPEEMAPQGMPPGTPPGMPGMMPPEVGAMHGSPGY